MRVLFIYTNINGFHEDTFPFGLAYIISVTKRSGHEADVVLVKTKEEYKLVLDTVRRFNPRVVGFTSVSSQFHFVKEIAALIKRDFPSKLIVCGGVHTTINPGCVAETKAIDAVFVGESEQSFVEFLEAVEKGRSYKHIDNIAYVSKSGKVIKNRLKPLITNLDILPPPDRSISLFEHTLNSVGYAPFFFSRGCPYLCTYCSNHAIAKAYGLPCNRPRYRSPEASIREIEEVIEKYPISKIAIVDDIFGINKKWRREFCEKYKKRVKIRFFCLLRANVIDEEFVAMLKEAGCYRVSIGVESGNDYVRNTIMNRRMKTEQIIKAFALLHKYGLQTNALNIIGTPGETEDMIWDTIRLNRKIRPTSSGVNIFYPYKGTKLGDYCFEKGLVNEKLYYDFSNERRSSVLNYPEEYKQRLIYYRENWEKLIYRYDIVVRLKMFIKAVLTRLHIWGQLVKIKRMVLGYIYAKRRAAEQL